MKKIEKILKNLRDEIQEEVDFQFKKAIRESNTIGDLLTYKPDELDLNNFLSDEINREIKNRYRNKVQQFIKNKSLHGGQSNEI